MRHCCGPLLLVHCIWWATNFLARDELRWFAPPRDATIASWCTRVRRFCLSLLLSWLATTSDWPSRCLLRMLRLLLLLGEDLWDDKVIGRKYRCSLLIQCSWHLSCDLVRWVVLGASHFNVLSLLSSCGCCTGLATRRESAHLEMITALCQIYGAWHVYVLFIWIDGRCLLCCYLLLGARRGRQTCIVLRAGRDIRLFNHSSLIHLWLRNRHLTACTSQELHYLVIRPYRAWWLLLARISCKSLVFEWLVIVVVVAHCVSSAIWVDWCDICRATTTDSCLVNDGCWSSLFFNLHFTIILIM